MTPTIAQEELKPCPFCGGAVAFHRDEDCDGCHYIECKPCGAWFDFSLGADPENKEGSMEKLQEKMVPLWNRRAGDSDA